MKYLIYTFIGLFTGVFSGMLGIGGGLVVVPILVLCLGLSQHQAQGTSLAMMIPPITLLAAWRYYRNGHVQLDLAAFIAIGFALGGFIGAEAVQRIPDILLKKVFGITLLLASLKMVFF